MTSPELENLLSQAQSLEPLSRYEEALQHLDTVFIRAEQDGLLAFQAAARYHQAKILRIRGELGAAEERARQAFELFSLITDSSGQAQSLLVLGEVFSDQAKFQEFEEACREAVSISQRESNYSIEARGLTLLGTALIYQGNTDAAVPLIERSVNLYRQIGDTRGTATTLLMLGRTDHIRGRLETATRSIQEAIDSFETLGDKRALASAYFNLGLIGFERGQLDQALDFANRGVGYTEGSGEVPMRMRCMLLLSQIEVETSRFADATPRLRELEQLCELHNQQSILPEVLRTAAQARLEAGNLQEAESYARRAREAVADEDAYSQGTTHLALGSVLERQGALAEAETEFLSAIEALEEAEDPFEIGLAHLSYGQFLAAHGRPEDARRDLLQARDTFASLEAQSKIELIDGILATL